MVVCKFKDIIPKDSLLYFRIWERSRSLVHLSRRHPASNEFLRGSQWLRLFTMVLLLVSCFYCSRGTNHPSSRHGDRFHCWPSPLVFKVFELKGSCCPTTLILCHKGDFVFLVVECRFSRGKRKFLSYRWSFLNRFIYFSFLWMGPSFWGPHAVQPGLVLTL